MYELYAFTTIRYNKAIIDHLSEEPMFRFFRRKKSEPVATPESQAPEPVESAVAQVTSEPAPPTSETVSPGHAQRHESVDESIVAPPIAAPVESLVQPQATKAEPVLEQEDVDAESARADEDEGLVDMSNPNAAQQTGDVWMAAQEKLEPVPDAPEVPQDNGLPAPDADGKVRIRFSLGDGGFGGASDISDEELEAAALAEIPEDSPERYRREPEQHWEDESNDVDTEQASAEDTSIEAKSVEAESVEAKSIEAESVEAHEASEMPQSESSLSATPEAEKISWLGRLKRGLSRTGSSISAIFVGVKVDEDLFEELETALIMADSGVEATQSLLTKLRAKVKKDRIDNAADVKKALHVLLTEHLQPLEKTFMLAQDSTNVVMIAGVNGAGKTTSIGKLAHHFQANGASVLLAAGDTFRAAAREQLIEWGSRNNVQVIAQEGGDPAAVAFDAVNAGRARRNNVVMVDTAGRLPTQLHLMEELKKIRRVINKADASAPHEVLLVVDGNTGQNAIAQIRAFDAVLNLTGLVVTKLDGTAKGGILAAVAAGSQGVRPIPVYWIGVGEGLHDLQPFKATEFATALLGD